MKEIFTLCCKSTTIFLKRIWSNDVDKIITETIPQYSTFISQYSLSKLGVKVVKYSLTCTVSYLWIKVIGAYIIWSLINPVTALALLPLLYFLTKIKKTFLWHAEIRFLFNVVSHISSDPRHFVHVGSSFSHLSVSLSTVTSFFIL